MFWLLSMKKKKIHVVKNRLWKHVKKERENYKWKEINGIMINQPIDKYNHFFDGARYGHMAWNDFANFEGGMGLRSLYANWKLGGKKQGTAPWL